MISGAFTMIILNRHPFRRAERPAKRLTFCLLNGINLYTGVAPTLSVRRKCEVAICNRGVSGLRLERFTVLSPNALLLQVRRGQIKDETSNLHLLRRADDCRGKYSVQKSERLRFLLKLGRRDGRHRPFGPALHPAV